MLHYVDTNAGAVMQKHTTLQLDGNAQNISTTDMAAYSDGFRSFTTGVMKNLIGMLSHFIS